MGRGIDEELSKKLKDAWPYQERELLKIIFDESRIKEGTECWFPIKIEKGRNPHQYSREEKYLQDSMEGKVGFLLMNDNCD